MACPRPPRKLPTPQELGLPPKFDSWRPGQEDFLNVIITSQKRSKVGCAPTGYGKSPVVVGGALWSKKPTAIVTVTNGLLKQYMDDFSSIGMVSLMGKRNYQCDLRPDDPGYTCEEGSAVRCPNKGTINCPSSQAEMAAAVSPLVVTNYAKWTSSRMFGQGMSHFQQVIFDECDAAPDALAQAMQVVLNHSEIEEGLQMDFPGFPDCEDMAQWKLWASKARGMAEMAMVAAQARITGLSDPKPSWVRHYTHMRNLCRRLSILNLCRAVDWVVDALPDNSGYVFDPIRPARYAESVLLLKIPSIIGVSATVRPKTWYMLGQAKEMFDFHEFPSDFDPKRCPIYYKPVMRVDSYNTNLEMLWLEMDRIAARRRDRNGIVHTVSHTRREDIVRSSRYASSMIFNERGQPIAQTIEEFRSVYPGAIFVTPSVEAGYDFRDRQCEWQFLAKIPFDPPSKILKAREADDPEYRSYNAMRRMVQTFGRGMRSKTDQCENFIGDMHMDWFWPRNKHLAPKSFHGFLKRVDVLPQPPVRL